MNLSQPLLPDNVLALVVTPFAFLVLLSLYRRREGIRHFLTRAIVAEACYLATAFYLLSNGIQQVPALLIGAAVGVAAERVLIPRRSRHIPSHVRRSVISAYERKTGRRFNPSFDELDHDVPFSRGGSSTFDNLRVRSRWQNRRKGRKAPWWDLLGRS